MEGKKFSLNEVISSSIASLNGKCRKVLASSLVQYFAFLLTYIFTNSILISFTVYALFLPSQVKFLTDLANSKLEDVFKIGKKFVVALLVAMLFVPLFGIGLVLIIVPGVLVFINYALAFDYAKDGELGTLECFKKSKETLKGYRGQMILMFLSFLLILILFVGFAILLGWLLSLLFPILTYNTQFIWPFISIPMFYFLGTFVGVSAFLVFVFPIELIAISNMKGAIAQDKLYREAEQAKQEEEKAKAEKDAVEAEPKVEAHEDAAEEKLKDDANDGNIF